jgi:ribosomal protein S20
VSKGVVHKNTASRQDFSPHEASRRARLILS